MQNKVFVCQDVPKLNLAPAKVFGRLEFVLPPGDYSRNIDKTIARIKLQLARWEPGDYLLPIGDPLIIGLTMTIALRYAKGVVNVLRWDRQEAEYNVIEIEEV